MNQIVYQFVRQKVDVAKFILTRGPTVLCLHLCYPAHATEILCSKPVSNGEMITRYNKAVQQRLHLDII